MFFQMPPGASVGTGTSPEAAGRSRGADRGVELNKGVVNEDDELLAAADASSVGAAGLSTVGETDDELLAAAATPSVDAAGLNVVGATAPGSVVLEEEVPDEDSWSFFLAGYDLNDWVAGRVTSSNDSSLAWRGSPLSATDAAGGTNPLAVGLADEPDEVPSGDWIHSIFGMYGTGVDMPSGLCSKDMSCSTDRTGTAVWSRVWRGAVT